MAGAPTLGTAARIGARVTTGHFTASDGCRLVFACHGEGPPVLWQHGLGATRAQPDEVFPEAPARRRITLECRGHGESDLGDAAALSIARFAEDALELLDHLGVERATLGGISLGAAIAMRLGALHSARVSGLILARPAWVDAPFPPPQRLNALAGALLREHGVAEGKRRMAASPEFAALRAASPDNAASLIGYFDRPRPETTAALLAHIPQDGPGVTRAMLGAIRSPTLIIANGKDVVHPIAYAEDLAALIPSARLTMVTAKSVDRAAYVREFKDALAGFLTAGE